MKVQKTLILNEEQIRQKIRRIAFQIYENNFTEEEIIFAGIAGSGYTLALWLQKDFEKISPIANQLMKLTLDKQYPIQSDVELDRDIESVEGKSVVIIDDVLHTGRTLAYSLKPFLNVRIKRLQTAVLVDRKYKDFPVSADYVGYSLSTTLQDRVDVFLGENEEIGVYLS